MSQSINRRQRGFTLVELLVTVIVVGVIIGLAGPNFSRQVLNNRSVAFGEDLVAMLNAARYEAINRATNVSICASSDGTTCTGAWTDGYIVFVDNASSSTSSAPVIGTIIRRSEKMDPKAQLTLLNNNTTAVSFIRFTSLGMLGRISNSNNAITVKAQMTGCKGNKNAREITIGLSGIISVEPKDCQ